MGRPRRTIVPLNVEATSTRTEAESFGASCAETPVLALASPVEPVEPETAPEAPQRSPARQKLADAIETVRQLEAEVASASAAVSEAEQRKWKTSSALREAEEELERAKPRPGGVMHLREREPHTFHSAEEYEAYNARRNAPPPSIEGAKAAVATATDARDSALAAFQFHERRLKAVSDTLSYKRSYIDDALRLAVHYDPAMAALAAETKSLATRAAAAERAFTMAVGTSLLQADHAFFGSTKPTDYREDPEGWAIVHRWREALQALKSDPDAPLPMPPAA